MSQDRPLDWNAVVIGKGAAVPPKAIARGAANTVLTQTVVNDEPAFTKVDLTTMVTGVLPPANGGGGGGATPTGTGFVHVTGGVQDAAAKLVDTADINNSQVTYAKMQNFSLPARLLGRNPTVVGPPEEISIGSGLTLTGTVLTATGSGGTVTTTGTPASGQVAVMSGGTSITSESALAYDVATNALSVNGGTLLVQTPDTGGVPLTAHAATTATGGPISAAVVLARSTGQMATGFGPTVDFYAQDADGVPNRLAGLYAARSGTDDTGAFAIATFIAGTAADRISVNAAGDTTITGTTTLANPLPVTSGGTGQTVGALVPVWLNGIAVAAGVTVFLGVDDSTNSAQVQWPSPVAGVLSRMFIRVSGTGPGGTETFTYQARVNGVLIGSATVLTGLTIQGSDVTLSAAVALGDTLTVRLITSAAAAVLNHQVSLVISGAS